MICGLDIPVPACELTIHQPTLKEIALIGEKDFFIGAQCLTLNKSMFVEDKNNLESITNFQIFMTIMKEPQAKDKKDAVMEVFTILFPKAQILLTPNSLIFKEEEITSVIDSNNFEEFQSKLKMIFCAKEGPMDQQSFNPANEKAKAIADKIMRGRQIAAEQKGSNNTSIFSQYISILTIGLHVAMQDFMNLTMFQLYDLVERYMLYMNWDIDVKQRLAGGNPEEHPDNWMKNIH